MPIVAARSSTIRGHSQWRQERPSIRVKWERLAVITSAQGREQHFAAGRTEVGVQHGVEKRDDPLVLTRRHRQYLQVSIGELHKPACVVGQPEVVAVAPAPLRKHLLDQGVHSCLGRHERNGRASRAG